jgi:hypothetical protein
MYNSMSSPTVTNCIFSRNSANYGGGISNDGSKLTLIDCTFSDNTAVMGSGMENYVASSVTLTNCIFSRNAASKSGGGMYNNSFSTLTLTNCTFFSNSAAESGGGIKHVLGGATLTNCIFWDNLPQEIVHISASVIVTYSDVRGGWPGEGNINADPLFVDVVNDNYHLLAHSPCINAGDPNYVAEPNETDLDGNPRVIGGRIDMGAYEFHFSNCWDCNTQCYGDSDCDGKVNNTDFANLKNSWFKSYPDLSYNPCADFDKDMCVDTTDFFILKDHWFQTVDPNCLCCM